MEEVAEAGEDCIMRSFIFVRFTKYNYGGHIKEDGMSGTSSTDGKDEKRIQYFGQKASRKETT